MSGTAAVSWAELSAAIAANPHRSVACGLTGARRSVAALPKEVPVEVSWLPAGSGWTEETTFVATDVLSFVLWVQDPMYRAATEGVRRGMEREAATTLLNGLDAAWRSHHGKARGWIRKHLEEDLGGRSAGTLPVPEFWARLQTVRRVALLADYILICRGMRMGVWRPTAGTVTMMPLSGGGSAPVAQLNGETGRPMLSAKGELLMRPASAWADLVTATPRIGWQAPACAPSAGSSTVGQIQERLGGVGCSGRTGSRASLWSLLQWELLVRDLAGVPAGVVEEIEMDVEMGAPLLE
jgi:hypothetical protein